MSFIVVCEILNFLACYINSVSATRQKRTKLDEKLIADKRLIFMPKVMIEIAFRLLHEYCCRNCI